MSEIKHKTFECLTAVKRYGRIHEAGDPIEIEADATKEIDHLVATGAIQAPGNAKPEPETKAAPEAKADVDTLAAAVQRMIERDPDKTNAELWTQSGKPECDALADEAKVPKVSAKERDAALAALAQ